MSQQNISYSGFSSLNIKKTQALFLTSSNQLKPTMIINMIKSILCLSLLTTPLLAQPEGFNSLTKRHDTLSLEIYIKEAEFPSDKDLKAINCTTAYPVGANPVTLELSSHSFGYYGATFGDGLDIRTWTNKVYSLLLASVPLRADESTRTFCTQDLGKGKDLNVSHDCIIPDHL
jgi:hypothetical protein